MVISNAPAIDITTAGARRVAARLLAAAGPTLSRLRLESFVARTFATGSNLRGARPSYL